MKAEQSLKSLFKSLGKPQKPKGLCKHFITRMNVKVLQRYSVLYQIIYITSCKCGINDFQFKFVPIKCNYLPRVALKYNMFFLFRFYSKSNCILEEIIFSLISRDISKTEGLKSFWSIITVYMMRCIAMRWYFKRRINTMKRICMSLGFYSFNWERWLHVLMLVNSNARTIIACQLIVSYIHRFATRNGGRLLV